MATPAQERKAVLTEAFGSNADGFGKILDSMAKINYDAYRFKLDAQQPVYQERQALAAKVPNFWPKSLANCASLAAYIDPVDRDLLAALEDVWVNYGKEDIREVEFVFKFKDNKYLKNNTLTKKLTPKIPADFAKENGVDQPDQYDLEATLWSDAGVIEWKSDEVDLVKQKPLVHPEELEEFDEFESRGSFFNFFVSSGVDAEEVAEQLLQWWEKSIEFCAGMVLEMDFDDDEDDDEDSEDEDEDSEEEENKKKVIDLDDDDRPKKKSKKN